MEALTPDFQGVLADVETVVDSGLDVFAQNVETVRRLTHPVRDPRASYEQTLAVLAHARRHRPGVLTKTSLMLGLGETDDEITTTMDDLRAVGVDILTLGQYLRPTVNHLPVERFVTPEEFESYRAGALARGFLECVAGPLVRSSYRAEQALDRNNAGLGTGGIRVPRQRRPIGSRRSVAALARDRSTTSPPGTPCSASRTRAGATRRTRSGFSSIRRYSRWA